ncbi:MAG: acetolactate synthase small subunit [Nanoarchaeota archaeon]|nr:acetolactate synthase small subunit [Nanoarchaeota archaeon]MBU1004422.1 acetolactate synthase small subunit [Nanoarchaeota archaeon]MBU1946691.1 acetolactate synthase small subunit [Nanoarchaeota archaeon]
MTKEKRHVISMLVEDQPGVLTRIAGMFARRGFNIDTITVGKTTKAGVSKMVITVIGDDQILEQVEKQVNKLIDTIKVMEMTEDKSIIRELCLIKVAISNKKAKDEILRYTKIYKTKIVDITPKTITAELIGDPDKIDSFIELMKQFGVKEVSRTGVTAVSRG